MTTGGGAQAAATTIMRVIGLEKSCCGLEAVDVVSFDMNRGEILGIPPDLPAGRDGSAFGQKGFDKEPNSTASPRYGIHV